MFALGVAIAASHQVTITAPVFAGGTELKPGDYQVQVDNGKAVFKNKKTTVEVPAKMETANAKFPMTAISTQTTGGKTKMDAIELGGTNMRIVFEPPATLNVGE